MGCNCNAQPSRLIQCVSAAGEVGCCGGARLPCANLVGYEEAPQEKVVHRQHKPSTAVVAAPAQPPVIVFAPLLPFTDDAEDREESNSFECAFTDIDLYTGSSTASHGESDLLSRFPRLVPVLADRKPLYIRSNSPFPNAPSTANHTVDPLNFLSDLPEDNNIDFRYSVILVGMAGDDVRKGLVEQSGHGELTSSAVELRPLSLLCQVPDPNDVKTREAAFRSSEDEAEEAIEPKDVKLARFKIVTVSAFRDNLPDLGAKVDVLSTVVVYVLRLSLPPGHSGYEPYGGLMLNEQVSLLKVFSSEYAYRAKAHHPNPGLFVLCLLGDESLRSDHLPIDVQSFCKKHKDIECVFAIDGSDFGVLLSHIATRIPTKGQRQIWSDWLTH